MTNLYRSSTPEDYSLHTDTRLMKYYPAITSIIEQIDVPKGRVRVFAQRPQARTKLHLDLDNVGITNYDEYQYRLWIPLSDTPKAIYVFTYGSNKFVYSPKPGDMFVFDPDVVLHGGRNLDTKTRYSLHVNCKSSEWLERLVNGGTRRD